MRLTSIAFAAFAALTAASLNAAAPTEQAMSRATFAGRWPFTVDQGVVGCDRGNAVKFVVGPKTYAINGTARALSGQLGSGWRDVREIWSDDPTNPGAKIDMGAVIAAGLSLCRPW